MYTSDCVWNCFAFVMALRWAIAFQAMTASGPTRTWVPADGADAGAVGDAAQALSTATATRLQLRKRAAFATYQGTGGSHSSGCFSRCVICQIAMSARAAMLAA